MKWHAEIESSDIQKVQRLVEQQSEHPFVKDRYERNVIHPPDSVGEEDLWQSQIMCLITTQNKSGLGSAVDSFLRMTPFPLSLAKLQGISDPDREIERVLSKLRIRRWKISASFAQNNLRVLEAGGWKDILELSQQLSVQAASEPESIHFEVERTAAQSIQDLLKGLGPKQSRNFWQDLGLFRYEIPLDSRVMGWLRKALGFYLPSSGLSDEHFYCQIMDAIQSLCFEAGVLPCILDAAIFSTYETQVTESNDIRVEVKT